MDLTRRVVVRTTCIMATVGTAGCTTARDSESDGDEAIDRAENETHHMVTIDEESGFKPTRLEIEVGETVRWENAAPPRQTVTAYDDSVPDQSEYFASGGFGRELTARITYPFIGGLNQGERYSYTFEAAGTYQYFSIPNETDGTTGEIVVTE
ncbi:plastocyanin/azurin family copper-binding protein [Natronococcus sp. A-GB7]|uniref:plastocyanin/azurin family copper-binding protein n=1 Tax=Natronococcus sp. A-GB7 TaxID=3037649 RepID=UPI00241EDBAD|nr:plastocyanin/azurin family copper-binding protein [Natronococcus sp. A-GB7]MDG5821394.1 plastocyanin/azurin family copper-binding protein [Natronococcus sp. A-GB7]